MKVLLFGILRENIGSDYIHVKSEEATSVAALINWMINQYPFLNELNTCVIAVNGAYTATNSLLSSDDEVALIPPVSGG